MAGIAMARRWVALVVLGLGASLLAIVGPSVGLASAEGEVTVTWPEVTRFNPDMTPYVVETAYDGPGELRIGPRAEYAQPMPSTGTFEVSFDRDGTHGLSAFLCDPYPTCSLVESSPDLTVFRQAHLKIDAATHVGPATAMGISATPAGTGGLVQWEVVPVAPPNSAPVASGSFAIPETTQFPSFEDAGLVNDASYRLRGAVTMETEDFGQLRDSFEQAFVWDGIPPDIKTMGAGHLNGNRLVVDDVFYPAEDRYLDVLTFVISSRTPVHRATVEVRDESDEVVWSAEADTADFDVNLDDIGIWKKAWRGVDGSGSRLPAGDYVALLRASDKARNTVSATQGIRISDKRKVVETWTRTFKAAPTVGNKTVGRCGTLKSPARSGWSGSLGYWSHTPCSQPDETVVATTNGVYIAPSPFREYEGIRVTVNGGRAKGERNSFLMLYYLNRKRDWVAKTKLSDGTGAHRGEWLDGRQGVLNDDNGPYVVWSVGLWGGAKYDVKSFAVEVKRVVLR